MAYNEYKLLMSIQHENIVKMHEAFFNQMKHTMYLVMDLVPGHSLKHLVENQNVKYTECQAKLLIKQVLNVIEYLQNDDISICHRDINPNNVIVNNMKITLIDFNVARKFREEKSENRLLMMTNTGTAKYQAPEMLHGAFSSYDEKVDLWSAGCLLYYILTGSHAFPFELQVEIENAIAKGEYGNDQEYKKLSENAKNLIENLMKVDPY